ncbi:MAG: AraC family transcriptional regulator ligand-binding domain-containing protein [Hahellaceae bacterium]|nr:AraC family transcriptional regulator ligand-binding domain-containing protein [Hahellaceae bacterium]MCP5168287.1 AraC family transcriptional regulator ligand-binding domain-containing protein [Hahellaceae bacterium]
MLNNLFITSDVSGLLAEFVTRHRGASRVVDIDARTQALLQAIPHHRHLSFEQWWQLLDELAACFDHPALGLQIGECVKVEHFGCLGYLLKTSKNLEQALRSFERFQRLLYDGNQAQLSFEPINGQPVAKLSWQADYGYSSQLSDELLLSGLLALSRTILANPRLTPLRIEFTNQVPEALASLYQDYFGCEVHFECRNLAVSFPAAWLALPIVGSDEHLHHLMNQQAINLLGLPPDDAPHYPKQSEFVSELHRVLVRALQEGEPSVEKVAAHFHLSARSLHRKLQEEGLVFRDFLRDIRKTLAERYLGEDKISLPEIALMLGYSEQSAFSRAFKQWYGQTPVRYQKQKFRSALQA